MGYVDRVLTLWRTRLLLLPVGGSSRWSEHLKITTLKMKENIISKTNVQRRAEKIAALMAEQQAYEVQVKEAVKSAAFARCDAVEQLYDVLGVELASKMQHRQKERSVV